MTALIEVGGKRIGPGHPCYVIAEIGVNHNGDVGLAHRLIDAAAEVGADAVKTQAFDPQLVVAENAPKAEYQTARDSAESQREMLARLALHGSAHGELKAHAETLGVAYFASPFDEPSVAMLERLSVPAIKVASGEITNQALLSRVTEVGVPIILSTGMSTLEEVDNAVRWLASTRDRLALLHCVSSYPADPRDCNLLAMELMRNRYGVPVGWSDHTPGIVVALAAAALGANVIEKHLTLDSADSGPDHQSSIEPEDFRSMVKGIRSVEEAVGAPTKRPAEAELQVAAVARRSLHWRRSLGAHALVHAHDLIALRPGTGIPPAGLEGIVGSRTRVPTRAGAMVNRSELKELSESDG